MSRPELVTDALDPRPPGLGGQVPDDPGEIRFAKVRVTAQRWQEHASAAHARSGGGNASDLQDYVLAKRLPGANSSVPHHHRCVEPARPEQQETAGLRPDMHIPSIGSQGQGRLQTEFSEGSRQTRHPKIESVISNVKKSGIRTKTAKGKKTIYYSRSDPRGHEVRPMSGRRSFTLYFRPSRLSGKSTICGGVFPTISE